MNKNWRQVSLGTRLGSPVMREMKEQDNLECSTFFFFCFTEAFTTFPLLQELELMLNSIVDVSINQGDFIQLQVEITCNSLRWKRS